MNDTPTPTESEIADVYNSIRCAWGQCETIYGAGAETIARVLNYWVKCEKELTAARNECARWRQSFDGHVYVKDEEYAELCEKRRQRDRMAEALESIIGEAAFEGIPESKQQFTYEALQSLDQPTER